MDLRIMFSDGQVFHYDSFEDAQDAILEAHCEGVGVDYIEDEDENPYSCLWSVTIQKES